MLTEFNKDHFHLKHAVTVEGVMRYFAKELGYSDEEDFWGIAGLLHELDFEQFPEQHCIKEQEIMRERGLDERDILSTFFAYPVEIRKIIYTTNIIEGLNRQFRKVTKTKSVSPNDDSLRKMLYLASQNITKKWTQRYKNWDIVIRQLEIMHENNVA